MLTTMMAHLPVLSGFQPRCRIRAVSSSQQVTQLRLAGTQIALIAFSGTVTLKTGYSKLQLVDQSCRLKAKRLGDAKNKISPQARQTTVKQHDSCFNADFPDRSCKYHGMV